MHSYNTKPVTVKAVQLFDFPWSIREAEMFINDLTELNTGRGNDIAAGKWEDYCRFISQDGGMYVKSLEKRSTIFVPFGNYIVKCPVSGNFYSFDPIAFNSLYETPK